jgi:hypothetical protein
VEEQAQMEPYVMNLRNPYDDQMKWELEDPAPHQVFFYNQAIENLAEELGVNTDDDELIPDGGRPRKYFWAWRDENGNYISDTTINGDSADIAKESLAEAERMMERLMESNPEQQDRYENAGCYKIKIMDKEMEGVEINTEQSGLDQFAPDGGYVISEPYEQELMELAESADRLEW